MGRKRHTPEQIISKLQDAEVELAKGHTTAGVCRKLGITEQTYYKVAKGVRRAPAGRREELDAIRATSVRGRSIRIGRTSEAGLALP